MLAEKNTIHNITKLMSHFLCILKKIRLEVLSFCHFVNIEEHFVTVSLYQQEKLSCHSAHMSTQKSVLLLPFCLHRRRVCYFVTIVVFYQSACFISVVECFAFFTKTWTVPASQTVPSTFCGYLSSWILSLHINDPITLQIMLWIHGCVPEVAVNARYPWRVCGK